MPRLFPRISLAGAPLLAWAATSLLVPRDAEACGGCFHPAVEVGASVVTDHRMAIKVSTSETILWDQVRYAGDPKEFAWVLPVRDGATIELARDAFLTALDAGTQSTVQGPERFCGGGGGGSSSGGGCGSFTTLTSSDDSASFSGGAAQDAGSAGRDVEVLASQVVGPYQAVTIRAKQGTTGIDTWLKDNGFAIPDEVAPVVDAYTKEGFDFIALRLRPGQGVRSMRPVRVVTKGADPTLPLRMVAAGIGSHVGLTLFVVSEGRYQTRNFPNAGIDATKLVWDGRAARSNLGELTAAALASNDGRTWLTEGAIRMSLTRTAYGTVGYTPPGATPNLRGFYEQQCITRAPQTVPCAEAASELPPANGSPDTGYEPADAGAEGDAGDAGQTTPPKPTTCTTVVSGCDGFDDVDVVARGLHGSDVWVTRLRADLPVAALDRDLQLEASPTQVEDSPNRHTDTFSDPTFDPCTGTSGASSSSNASGDDSSGSCACRTTRFRHDGGSLAVMAATAWIAARVARRKRRS